jgi:hypothetical protein
MPTIHRYGGFRIAIYPADHPPPHVHVIKADGYAVIEIETLFVRRVDEMRDKDVARAVRIVAELHDVLIESWKEIHG